MASFHQIVNPWASIPRCGMEVNWVYRGRIISVSMDTRERNYSLQDAGIPFARSILSDY